MCLGLECQIEKLADEELTCLTPRPIDYPQVPVSGPEGFPGDNLL